MEDKSKVFKEYVESFKDLSLERKKDEFIKSLKEFIVILDSLAKQENIPLEYVHSNEILDLQKNSVDESDFIEASFVYLEVLKDIVGQYLIQKENSNF